MVRNRPKREITEKEPVLETMLLYEQDDGDQSTHGAEVVILGEKEDWQGTDYVRIEQTKDGVVISGSGRYIVIGLTICAITFIVYIFITQVLR